jgi:aminocarboxymuconate-semialdehyde decarboxylase
MEHSIDMPVTIDIHSLIVPEEFLLQMERTGVRYGIDITTNGQGQRYLVQQCLSTIYDQRPLLVDQTHWDISLRIENMQRTNLHFQVLSPPATQFIYMQPPKLGAQLAMLINDSIAQIVNQHPDRFLGICTVPLQDPALAAIELERGVGKLGLVGVEIGSSVNKWQLDNQALWPFWEAVEELDVPIFISGIEALGVMQMQRWSLSDLFGVPIASNLALAQLIFGGVLEAFPSLKLVNPNGAGILPYIRGRLDHGYQVNIGAKDAIPRPPSTYLSQIYFGSIMFYEPALQFLIEAASEDHVLLCTNFPFPLSQPDCVSMIVNHPFLSPPTKEKILGGNAKRLLGLNDEFFH